MKYQKNNEKKFFNTLKHGLDLMKDLSSNCQNCGYTIHKQRHQMDKEVLRQDKDLSIRLFYANENLGENYCFLVNIKYESTENMITKLKNLKSKRKIMVHHYFSI